MLIRVCFLVDWFLDVFLGDYVTVNMNSVPFEELPTYVWGTAAMPGVFQYWEKDGFIFIDGGSTLNLDAFAAVHRCREFVDYDSEITIDILLNSPSIFCKKCIFINFSKVRSTRHERST
jgi:hypothetical protein